MPMVSYQYSYNLDTVGQDSVLPTNDNKNLKTTHPQKFSYSRCNLSTIIVLLSIFIFWLNNNLSFNVTLNQMFY